jgi:hypothetical protein
MKKITVFLLVLFTITSVLTGCGKYISSWNAFCMVQTNTSKKASMSFSTFEGTMVMTLKPDKEKNENIAYTAKLEKGSATVYYDHNGTKTELFSIKAGGEISSVVENFENEKVYLIIESNEKCEEGKLTFEVE